MFFMFLKEKKKKKIKKNSAKITVFVLPVAEICSTKICTREYCALMVFGVSNEYALNPQGIFNLYSYTFICVKISFLFCPGGKKDRWGKRKW